VRLSHMDNNLQREELTRPTRGKERETSGFGGKETRVKASCRFSVLGLMGGRGASEKIRHRRKEGRRKKTKGKLRGSSVYIVHGTLFFPSFFFSE
jgi:hypothetical protein